MKPTPADDEAVDRLSGWKEIAQYLRRSVRSVQRWEHELKLPIKRVKTAHGQVVYASRAELDAWMLRFHELPSDVPDHPHSAGQPADAEAPAIAPAAADQVLAAPDRPRLRFQAWHAVALIAVVGLIGLGLGWFRPGRTTAAPVTVSVQGRVLEARDLDGRVAWTFRFDEEVRGIPELLGPPLGGLTMDLNGDGAGELLVPVRFPAATAGDLTRTDALYAFTAAGEVLWSATLPSSYSLTCGGEAISGPWKLRALGVSKGAGPKTIWAAFNHLGRRPGVLLEITADGRQAIRYIQAGRIMDVTDWTTAGGPALAVVGGMSEHARGSLVTFDPGQALTMMAAANPAFTCVAQGALPPSKVTLFPPDDLAVAYDHGEAMANKVMPLDAGLKIDLAGGAIAMVEGDGRVSEILFTDEYRLMHDRLSREGRLDHLTADCPALRGPGEVRTWTPLAGWQTSVLPVAHWR